MRQFMIRVAGILMLLSTVLLVEGLAEANLPLLAAFCLLPLSVLLTVKLLGAGAHSRRRKRRASLRRKQAAHQRTLARPAGTQPVLRVAGSPAGHRAA